MADATKPTTEVEVWVLVTADAEYSVGTSEEDANQRFEDECGTVQGNRRMVKLTLTVPLPKPQELRAEIPADDPAPTELEVEAA